MAARMNLFRRKQSKADSVRSVLSYATKMEQQYVIIATQAQDAWQKRADLLVSLVGEGSDKDLPEALKTIGVEVSSTQMKQLRQIVKGRLAR